MRSNFAGQVVSGIVIPGCGREAHNRAHMFAGLSKNPWRPSSVEPSCENCGLQFGDDHIGLYIRCEAALSLLMAIRALMPEKLDINSASMEQLAALKGIGEIYAAMINRERPYQTTNELIKKKAIPAAIYDQIKNDITAKQGVGEMAVQKP